jgi:L-arabinokinase
MDVFPHRKDVPLVVREARSSREQIRRALGFAEDPRPLVLISFGGLALGGFGLDGFGETSVRAIDDVVFVAFGQQSAETPAHVLRIRDDSFHFPDLVNAADAVISKLGYGIVAEATAFHTGLLYTPRPDFPEYQVIAERIGRFVPAAEVSVDELCTGAFAEKLRKIVPKKSSEPSCSIDGARIAAEEILST